MADTKPAQVQGLDNSHSMLQVGPVDRLTGFSEVNYWHVSKRREDPVEFEVEIPISKEKGNLESLEFELSFSKRTKEPLPEHLLKVSPPDQACTQESERLPLQVVYNTGATPSEPYQQCSMVTPDEETFSTNYGAPEFIFALTE